MAELSTEANEVLNYLASMPQVARRAVPKKLLREILLYTDGRMFLQGRTWNVVTDPLGVDIYRLSLALDG